jgi:hypothetical protein
MQRVAEAEAWALLNKRQICPDMREWRPHSWLIHTWRCESGVVTEEGIRSSLWVELLYRNNPKTRKIWFKFSVHQRHPWGTQGVYQLDVEQYSKPLQNAHDRPHEHMGAVRTEGEDTWSRWSFEEVIQRFCLRTKIDFLPPVQHPENFELRG